MSQATWQDREIVDTMLDDLETWAVVGLSGNPDRTAYRIARLLQERGKRIVPIHPDAPTVLGEQGYATLADVPFPVDVVDVFRRSGAAGQFADEAVAVGAKGVWFQLGVIDEAAFERTTAAGVPMVMDTCPAIEFRARQVARQRELPRARRSSKPRSGEPASTSDGRIETRKRRG